MAKKHTVKPRRVIFKDGLGRFVAAEDRYKKATTVMVRRGKKYVKVIEDSEVTPKKLAIVTTRQEFESLPPAFKHIKQIKPAATTKKTKNKTWDIARDITKIRGVRDKLIKVTVRYKKGRRSRTVSFYHKISARKKSDYTLFKHLKEAVEGTKLPHWYDISLDDLEALEEDQVDIDSVDVETVM